jgi:hypothetical protein
VRPAPEIDAQENRRSIRLGVAYGFDEVPRTPTAVPRPQWRLKADAVTGMAFL